jgi:PQQ-dependent catabolism-associated beta-propeller protein
LRRHVPSLVAGPALGLFLVFSVTAACRNAPPEKPHSEEEELVYVTNEDSGTLSILSAASDELLATLPVGKRPRGVRVSPDGSRVYVAASGSPKCPPTMSDEDCDAQVADRTEDGIVVVDPGSRKVTGRLPGGSDPEQFDVSRDGRRLFVSNEDAGVASVVDVDVDDDGGRVVKSVPVGEEPEGVRASPDGSVVYVTSETEHRLTVISTATLEVVANIAVGHRPRDAVFSSDGKRAFVTSEIDGTLSAIDVPTHRVTDTVELPKGSRSMGVVLSPDDRRLYVSNGRAKTVAVLDASTLAIVGVVEVGERPWGLALTADGKKLYTANGPSNDVSVVDTGTLAVVKRIPVGESPWGVAVGRARPAGPGS